jgi:hypothetical protein
VALLLRVLERFPDNAVMQYNMAVMRVSLVGWNRQRSGSAKGLLLAMLTR